MASIWKHPESKYWTACFTDKDGKRHKRSTKATSRSLAQRLAHQYEEAAKKKLTKRAARRVISDIYQAVSNEPLPGETFKFFFDKWVAESESRVSAGTYRKYSDERHRFLKFLGEKAKLDIDTINRADITAFQAQIAKGLSVSTANTVLKIIRVALNEAHRQGLIDSNPAAEVKILSTKDVETVRRPFTLAEIKKLMKLANREWRGAILLGFYTGQRLQDIITAKWPGIDLSAKTWTFVATKTGQRMELPLAEPVLEYLRTLKCSKMDKALVFPILAKKVTAEGNVGQASNQFHDLLVEAKLVAPRSKRSTGKGRSGPRKQNELSFHCLRHTTNSLLKAAGVPESVAMAIVGHESARISMKYTHVSKDSLIKGVKKLPVI